MKFLTLEARGEKKGPKTPLLPQCFPSCFFDAKHCDLQESPGPETPVNGGSGRKPNTVPCPSVEGFPIWRRGWYMCHRNQMPEIPLFQDCPTYRFTSLQNTEKGDPKIRNRDGPEGNSRKFRFSLEFPQKPSVQGIPGSLVFWGGFLGEMRVAKVDMLHRGDLYLESNNSLISGHLAQVTSSHLLRVNVKCLGYLLKAFQLSTTKPLLGKGCFDACSPVCFCAYTILVALCG